MKIAVLAWGSLIWNRGALHIASDFEPIGPILPIEFSRISRDGRLTLVISERHGSACKTYSAQSALTDLDEALENLWRRESQTGASVPKNFRVLQTVTYIDLHNKEIGSRASRHPKLAEVITTWATVNTYDAVIWTALGVKFKDELGVPFSIDAAITYLANLDAAKQAKAFEYIREAPAEIQTPVRTAFNQRWPSA